MYIAKHYVRINGRLYMHGEVIPDNLPFAKIEWLLKKDAIQMAEVAPEANEQPGIPETPKIEKPAEENDEEVENSEMEEIDEEAEAPEIDVMAGIVDNTFGKTQKKTTRTRSSKKAGRKEEE